MTTSDRTLSISCTVNGGRLKLFDRDTFDQGLRAFGDGEELTLTIEPTEQRKTRLQEKGFHAMIQPWAKAEGHRIDDLKRDLLRAIFGEQEHVNPLTRHVEMVLREPHTSTLSKTKYSELIERTLEIAAECGHVLVAPNEYRAWKDAKAAKRKKGAAA